MGTQKTVALLSTELDISTALNIVGHLSVAIGAACGDELIHSARYVDASGCSHLGVSAWPFIVLKTRPAKLRAALEHVRSMPGLVFADYPRQVLTTSTDPELASALAVAADRDLEYLGLMAHGPSDDINAVFGKFSLVKHDIDIKI